MPTKPSLEALLGQVGNLAYFAMPPHQTGVWRQVTRDIEKLACHQSPCAVWGRDDRDESSPIGG